MRSVIGYLIIFTINVFPWLIWGEGDVRLLYAIIGLGILSCLFWRARPWPVISDAKFFGILLVVYLAIWGFYALALHNKTLPFHYVALGSVVVTIFTWMITDSYNRKAARVHHTMSLLMQTRFSETFNRHIYRVTRFREAKKTISKENILEGKQTLKSKIEIYERKGNFFDFTKEEDIQFSLSYVLNYFEFICAGINSGDFDEELLKKTIRAHLCNIVMNSESFIKSIQAENPASLESLTKRYDQWRTVEKEISWLPNKSTSESTEDKGISSKTGG